MTDDTVAAADPTITHKSPLGGRRFARVAAVVILWSALAWGMTSWLTQYRTAALVADRAAEMQRDLHAISENFNRALTRLQGVAAVLGAGSDVGAALASFGPEVLPSQMPPAARAAAWTQRPDLLALGKYLNAAALETEIDVIWVMNASGDCVAASNLAERTSFVGTNYADRQYFKEALAGERGTQYAMGRVTNVPGLFFSAPVKAGGRFLGAVAVKVDLANLATWVSHPHAFITDAFGVIILAGEPGRELRAMPGAAALRLSPEERMGRYKRSEFETFAVETAGGAPGGIVRVAGSAHPHVAGRADLNHGLSLHMLVPLSDIAAVRRDGFAKFLLLWVSGILFLALGLGTRIHFARARAHREAMEATNASLSRLNAHLDHLAKTDALTGCANRRHFHECLETEFARAVRYGRDCSLIIVDLDHFKRINDEYGHAAGDQTLKHFVRIVREGLRKQDVLGRLGGEEFAVLLPESSLQKALSVAERIRQALEASVVRFAGEEIAVTGSFGVASRLSGVEAADLLLHRADGALYAAKEAGRNRVVSGKSAARIVPLAAHGSQAGAAHGS